MTEQTPEQIAEEALQALKDSPPPQIPPGHVEWYGILKRAMANNDTCLMSCRDAITGMPVTVIAAIHMEKDEYVFTPLAQLPGTDNPYDAYIPPKGEEEARLQ